MLPAQAIIEAIERATLAEFPDYRDRIFLNRTVALSEAQGDMTGIVIRQGADEPFDGASTFDRIGMSLAVEISFIDIGDDEAALVARLNGYRLRMHRKLLTPGVLGWSWVLAVVARGADEPATSNESSAIAKEIVTRWGVAYSMDRRNPDV